MPKNKSDGKIESPRPHRDTERIQLKSWRFGKEVEHSIWAHGKEPTNYDGGDNGKLDLPYWRALRLLLRMLRYIRFGAHHAYGFLFSTRLSNPKFLTRLIRKSFIYNNFHRNRRNRCHVQFNGSTVGAFNDLTSLAPVPSTGDWLETSQLVSL